MKERKHCEAPRLLTLEPDHPTIKGPFWFIEAFPDLWIEVSCIAGKKHSSPANASLEAIRILIEEKAPRKKKTGKGYSLLRATRDFYLQHPGQYKISSPWAI